MQRKKGHSTLLLSSVSIVLFVIASRTRYPIFAIAAVISTVMTYLRFRSNYLTYRRKQAKLKRQSGAINVATTETRESEDQHV